MICPECGGRVQRLEGGDVEVYRVVAYLREWRSGLARVPVVVYACMRCEWAEVKQ